MEGQVKTKVTLHGGVREGGGDEGAEEVVWGTADLGVPRGCRRYGTPRLETAFVKR